jgi:hypothetical protein
MNEAWREYVKWRLAKAAKRHKKEQKFYAQRNGAATKRLASQKQKRRPKQNK